MKLIKMLLTILGLSMMLLASNASAAGWTGYGEVKELNPTTSGRFLLRLAVSSNPSGCRDKQWFYRDYGGAATEYLFQTLLTALSSGKQVRVYVTGRCDLKGYSDISSVSIIP